MTKTLLTLLLSIPLLAVAQDSAPKTAAQQRQQCASYVLDQKTTAKQNWENDVCYAYARGVKDAMDGDLAWLDDTHRKAVMGTWADGVTTDQLIRVFMQFADANPALLNKPATAVMRQAAEGANIYSYASVP